MPLYESKSYMNKFRPLPTHYYKAPQQSWHASNNRISLRPNKFWIEPFFKAHMHKVNHFWSKTLEHILQEEKKSELLGGFFVTTNLFLTTGPTIWAGITITWLLIKSVTVSISDTGRRIKSMDTSECAGTLLCKNCMKKYSEIQWDGLNKFLR